jgi:guanylate kinase
VIVVVSGPGGVGKGTVAARVLDTDDRLWLSRSWTTRARRPGEAADAYVFVDRAAFEQRIADGGFLEWAEFLGNLYGTPRPEPGTVPPGADVLLEIDVQGAEQVLRAEPTALVVFLDAPSEQVQQDRLEGRGDPPEQVARRLAKGAEERELAARLGATVLINDDLDRTVAELRGVIDAARADRAPSGHD